VPTQAEQRTRAKERVRKVKRALRVVDTDLEVLERRLDKLLERDRLITIGAFDSFLQNWDKMVKDIQAYEATLTNVMVIFRLFN
jgi:hypothetical protein